MVNHPAVLALIERLSCWPGYALKRHNDAKHLLYVLSTLADFGISSRDPGMKPVLRSIRTSQSISGAYQILENFPRAFGGTGKDELLWVLCDFPTILYSMIAIDGRKENGTQKSTQYLESLIDENGYRCKAAPALGKFKGPGKKTDPCPIANVYALKALSLDEEKRDRPAARTAIEALLSHWEMRGEKKYFLFGIGTDFRKLKYPFVWYDILHVTEVLSRFPEACADDRFREIVIEILSQADNQNRFTAGSMYMAWKGWSFANKKQPSPWLTFLVYRIQKRAKIPSIDPIVSDK
jgi:hypothetical protein